jgi:feruloyl esterase
MNFGVLGAWVAQSNTGPGGEPILTEEAVHLAQEAVYRHCDGGDGLEDGLIDDPRECSFDPASLQCRDDDQTDCLSPAQVETLRAWYGGPRNSAGESLYPGIPFGSEPYWGLWLTGTGGGDPGVLPRAAGKYLRYMAFREDAGEAYELADFDLDRDPERLEHMARLFNADDPDLGKFEARGGKLLIYQGWADAIVPPLNTVRYYEAVEKRVGSREQTQEFLRLFLIPGRDHCGVQSGPGIDQYGLDALTALEKWVEKGEPPASLLATKRDERGEVSWTRPVCPYPQRARYTGTGDVSEASSFECVDPPPF